MKCQVTLLICVLSVRSHQSLIVLKGVHGSLIRWLVCRHMIAWARTIMCIACVIKRCVWCHVRMKILMKCGCLTVIVLVMKALKVIIDCSNRALRKMMSGMLFLGLKRYRLLLTVCARQVKSGALIKLAHWHPPIAALKSFIY